MSVDNQSSVASTVFEISGEVLTEVDDIEDFGSFVITDGAR